VSPILSLTWEDMMKSLTHLIFLNTCALIRAPKSIW